MKPYFSPEMMILQVACGDCLMASEQVGFGNLENEGIGDLTYWRD